METISSENSNSKGYIAFFDLDRTITSVISGRAIALMAYRKGLLKNYSFLRAILLSVLYKLRLKDPLAAIPFRGLRELATQLFEHLRVEGQ